MKTVFLTIIAVFCSVYLASCSGKPNTNTSETVSTPVINPSSGIYSTDQNVSITCETSGAIIYYTTDGSIPTVASSIYTTPITVAGNRTILTLNAIAVQSGSTDSAVATAVININYTQVSTPNFSPVGATYSSDQNVAITCSTVGATIYYTTDGSSPNISSSVYSAPISVSGNGTIKTIKAYAVKSGMSDSTVAIATYKISYPKALTPSFNLITGSYTSDQSVSISCLTPGATIYYTIDGTAPSISSSVYITPIAVAGNGTSLTIKAMAVKSGLSNSLMNTVTITINYTQVSTPNFTPAAGTYSTDQNVALNCATSGATIYYTTDGTTPTASSSTYGSPIPIAGNGTKMTIKVMAVKSGMANSSVATGSFTISYPKILTPTFTPATGTYTSDQNVSISCATSGTTIYYTTDGSTPTTSSALFTSPITVAGNGNSMTIMTLAVKSGMTNSSIAAATYNISYATVGTPTYSSAAGIFAADQNITITSVTPGATIYYTTDGTVPNTSSSVFSTPIPVAGNGTMMTISAMAVKSGMLNSTMSSAKYTISYLGTVTTFAGSGATGYVNGTGTAATFDYPQGITSDGTNLYVADSLNNEIRKIVIATGVVSTFAGSYTSFGYNDGTGTSARFHSPYGITTDGTNLYIADQGNNEIRKIVISTGVVSTIAGNWSAYGGWVDATGSAARFNMPNALTTDGTNLYVADTGNQRIRQVVIATGVVTTIAGSGSIGFKNDIGTAAMFSFPEGITTDGTNLYVTDNSNSLIRKIVISTQEVTTLAGGMLGQVDGTGSTAGFQMLNGIAIDSAHAYLYVTDSYMIRKINISSGMVTTVAGSTVNGSTDATGSAARFYFPFGITVNGSDLYVSDTDNHKIRKVVQQ
jgi:hypothetical protein